MKIVFLVMALALTGGGAAAVFGINNGSSSGTAPDFVLPPDKVTPTGEPQPTVELKQYPAAPAMTIDSTKHYVATIKTADGDIQVELEASQVPVTVNNFVFLAKDGFYNGLSFYRVDEAFAARAGDPACTPDTKNCTGAGGPGYEIGQEKPGPFETGTLGMANGSQFFIALTASDEFSDFTPFGKITSGLDVAQRLTSGTEITAVAISES